MTDIHNDSRIYEESYEGYRIIDRQPAGTFYIPSDLPESDPDIEDAFTAALVAAMREPITDPGSAACYAPLIVRGNPPVQSRCRWCRNIGASAKCSNCGGIQ